MHDQQRFSFWVEQSLPSSVTIPSKLRLEEMAGDAGFRRYFRANSMPSLIAVDSPPEKEKNLDYVNISLFLQAQGLLTPKIYAVDFQQGFMLLEDFGCKLFSQQLEGSDSDVLYDMAETELLKMQATTKRVPTIALHNEAKIAEELALFEQWFLIDLLDYQLTVDEQILLKGFFDTLTCSAKEQPQVLIHADYHSRNLMVLESGNLGIIDFQDAMLGAITYDLVSLLKDCYLCWPTEWVTHRALMYKQRLEAANLMAGVDDKQFLQWFDHMGLQRHIKVLGIFSRLALRDAKNAYLNDIPLVVHYCLEASGRYPNTAPFNQWFKEKILPLLNQQSWYFDYSGKL